MSKSKADKFQSAGTFDRKLCETPDFEVCFNKLSERTTDPYQSTSSVASSASEKVGSPYDGLLGKSNNNRKKNTPTSSKSKIDSNNDLGLISATTSPFRSEWENKNRPFCTRFYPIRADVETEKDKFISILSSDKSQNGFLSPNPERHSTSIIQLHPTSPRRTEKVINIREVEKERLAQIFAFSSPLKKKYDNLQRNGLENLKTVDQLHRLTSQNLVPSTSNGCTDVKRINRLPEDINNDYNGNTNIVQFCDDSPSFQNERCRENCKNCSCSVSPRLEGNLVLNKEVQTYEFSTGLQQELISDQLDCYKSSGLINQKKFFSPELRSNGKENLSPRKFMPVYGKDEVNPVLFSPLQVATSPNHSGKRMVRIGEYSPLNPKLNSPGHALMGLGEYEERRKLLLEQRKHECCQYLEQARIVAKRNQELKKSVQAMQEESPSTNMKNAATQTDCSVSPRSKRNLCVEPDSIRSLAHEHPSDLEPTSEICGLNDVQMKQYVYREDLRKQIEEKQRIEAEKKAREKREEEAMEAKIKQQQEEMQNKYEADVAERMELALKKKQQEEALHHRLAEIQKQTLQDKKHQWKHRKETAAISPKRGFQQQSELIPEKEGIIVPYITPEKSPFNPYQEEREKIFKEIADIEKQYSGLQQYAARGIPAKDKLIFTTPIAAEKSRRNEPISSSFKQKVNKPGNKPRAFTVLDLEDPVSRAAQKLTEAEEILRRPLVESIAPHPHSPKSPPIKTKANVLRETADDILHMPLLPADNDVKNIRDAIPLLPRPKSPPIPAATTRARTNSEALDDKWQIPAVGKYLATPVGIHSHNSRSVLTQLGAFRKHLQQEQMRMACDLKSSKVKPS